MGWLAAAPDGAGLELGVGPVGRAGPGRNAAAACWGCCWIQPCSSAGSKLAGMDTPFTLTDVGCGVPA